MTTIAYPTSRIFMPSDLTVGLRRNITASRNPLTRRRKRIEYPGALWEWTLLFTPHSHAERAEIEAFWNWASDVDNVISLWHLVRPTPRGTLQANTTSAAASEGASTINVNATTGLTLAAGDMFSVALSAGGTQLVQVRAPVTSVSGVMNSVAFLPALVGAVANGAAVTVVKPTSTFALEEPFVPMQYSPGFAQSFPVVLVEEPSW